MQRIGFYAAGCSWHALPVTQSSLEMEFQFSSLPDPFFCMLIHTLWGSFWDLTLCPILLPQLELSAAMILGAQQ